MNAILLAMTMFVPHEYKTLDPFNLSQLSEQEYVQYVDWYEHVSDVEFFSITYKSDGCTVKGILAKPKKIEDKLPVIIYLRGGSEETGKMTVQTLKDKFYFWVKQGYVVIASQYRGVDGGEGKDELGGADCADVRNLFGVLKELSYADTGNVFMLGHSRGGQMALMALREHLPVKAAVLIAPVTDYFAFEKLRPDLNELLNTIIPGMPANKHEAYQSRSGVCWADEISVPLLVMHGGADATCDISQSISLTDELKKYGKAYKLVVYPGGDHLLTCYQDDINRQSLEWFEKYLGKTY
jgi:dipeptidyl aminopeptidase/acylaminoacyl peptidase